MKTKILLLLLSVLTLSGCRSNQQEQIITASELGQLGTVQVISREVGSGTRDIFAELVGFEEVTEDCDVSDGTVMNTAIKNSTSAVIDAVSCSDSAIGYISAGSVSQLQESKVLQIDGTSPTSKNIKSGKYPLSRPFYLAYMGKLNDLEQEFLTYITGKGQDIIREDFIPIYKSGIFLSYKPKGRLTLHGSTSMAPLISILADEYMKLNPNADIEIIASDSAKGLADAALGVCNFAMCSRELESYEKKLLDYELIGKDGIAVIVNQNNPLENLSKKALRQIYTGNIRKWKETIMKS